MEGFIFLRVADPASNNISHPVSGFSTKDSLNVSSSSAFDNIRHSKLTGENVQETRHIAPAIPERSDVIRGDSRANAPSRYLEGEAKVSISTLRLVLDASPSGDKQNLQGSGVAPLPFDNVASIRFDYTKL